MISTILFQPGAAIPPALYYVLGLLLAWVAYAAYVAWRLRHIRRQNDEQLKQEVAAATIAAPGQPDQPAREDTLHLDVAPVVVGLLTHPDTNEPYTVALSGDWGSGKSSVMLQIKDQLKGKLSFKAVHINVWHFQQEDHLLTGFLAQILAKCDDWHFRRRQIFHNLRHLGLLRTLYRAWVLTLALPVLLVIVVALVHGLTSAPSRYVPMWEIELLRPSFHVLAKLFQPSFYVIRNLTAALPVSEKSSGEGLVTALVPEMAVVFAIITVVGAVGASLKSLPDLIRPVIQLIPYQQLYKVAQGEAGFRQRYQDDFGNIIRNAAGNTLVIFIDDIDRISGPRVLEVLETLNFIITTAQARRSEAAPGAKLYFVLAMNVAEVVRVLGPVLDPHNQLGSPEKQSQLAASYLAKLVDLTVRIPSLQDRNIDALFKLESTSSNPSA